MGVAWPYNLQFTQLCCNYVLSVSESVRIAIRTVKYPDAWMFAVAVPLHNNSNGVDGLALGFSPRCLRRNTASCF